MEKHELPVLDSIIQGYKQPWLTQSVVLEEYNDLRLQLQPYQISHTPQFEIRFQKPFNPKTRYYRHLIELEVQKSIDQLLGLLGVNYPFDLRKYRHTEIMNMFQTRLLDIGHLIATRQLSLSFIDPQTTSFNQDEDHRSDTYIIQCLKLAYMQLLLEVQNAFPDLPDETYSEEELYMEFTKEPVPKSLFIHQLVTVQLDTVPTPPKKKKQAEHLYSFRYKRYDRNESALADLRNSLIKGNFIDETTPLPQFRRIFSGDIVDHPVKWTGSLSELSFFVKQLHKDHINDLGQSLWTVAIKCFSNPDGSPIERSIRKLSDLKQASKDAISKCLAHL